MCGGHSSAEVPLSQVHKSQGGGPLGPCTEKALSQVQGKRPPGKPGLQGAGARPLPCGNVPGVRDFARREGLRERAGAGGAGGVVARHLRGGLSDRRRPPLPGAAQPKWRGCQRRHRHGPLAWTPFPAGGGPRGNGKKARERWPQPHGFSSPPAFLPAFTGFLPASVFHSSSGPPLAPLFCFHPSTALGPLSSLALPPSILGGPRPGRPLAAPLARALALALSAPALRVRLPN